MGVTGETLVLTADGYQQVGDLVNEVFTLLVNHYIYDVIGYGFTSSGNKDVFRIKISNGSTLKASGDHKLLMIDGSWSSLRDIQRGDKIRLSNEHEIDEGEVTAIGYVGCFYVYDCAVHNGDRYISEGGFINKTN